MTEVSLWEIYVQMILLEGISICKFALASLLWDLLNFQFYES